MAVYYFDISIYVFFKTHFWRNCFKSCIVTKNETFFKAFRAQLFFLIVFFLVRETYILPCSRALHSSEKYLFNAEQVNIGFSSTPTAFIRAMWRHIKVETI